MSSLLTTNPWSVLKGLRDELKTAGTGLPAALDTLNDAQGTELPHPTVYQVVARPRLDERQHQIACLLWIDTGAPYGAPTRWATAQEDITLPLRVDVVFQAPHEDAAAEWALNYPVAVADVLNERFEQVTGIMMHRPSEQGIAEAGVDKWRLSGFLRSEVKIRTGRNIPG